MSLSDFLPHDPMNRPRSKVRLGFALLALTTLLPPAHAIYKCTAAGTVIYQQAPCAVDREQVQFEQMKSKDWSNRRTMPERPGARDAASSKSLAPPDATRPQEHGLSLSEAAETAFARGR